MSSLLRRLRRNALRKSADYEPNTQPTVVYPDGSYRTLHPTRGWRYISAKRLQAQQWMAGLLDHAIPERIRKPAKLWRKPAPPAPSIDSRQQRRHRERQARA